MSGHSKWHSIKHKKAVIDAKRGKLFTKLIRRITTAARQGGGDPANNAALRLAIEKAKAANMPAENIDRAIKKGTGELPGVNYEEVVYEGYGPGGTAILMEVLTDNKNRTNAEIKHIFSRNGGNLGEAGCVAWLFEKKGVIVIERNKIGEEELMNCVIEAGAEDMTVEGENYEVLTDPRKLEAVKKYFDSKNIPYEDAEVSMMPKNTVRLQGDDAKKVMKLMETLSDHDDVENVYANFDINDEMVE